MAGIQDLNQLLQNMTPELHEGDYVFTIVLNSEAIASKDIICKFKEREGYTLVLERTKADEYGLHYEYVAAWITLTVHSSLDAVGLTAAFSTALAQAGISCNVIAGYYHDHIFVNKRDGAKAMAVLKALSKLN